MKTKLLFYLLIFSVNIALAQQFIVNNIKYNVTSSSAPLTVEVISKYPAYSGAITIPETVINSGNTYAVTTIGDNAFWSFEDLTSIIFPNSLISIGESAFYKCTGLTSLIIPNSVTSIERWAFKGCTGLTSLDISNSVTSIGVSSFSDCTGLTTVTIPNSVTSISESSFSNCTGLTTVTIPNSVITIEQRAFIHCSSLTNVSIPNSVTSIGNFAFNTCSSLTNVSVNVLDPADITLGISIFTDTLISTGTLTVPTNNSVTAYESARTWKDFGTIVSGVLSTNNYALENAFSVYPNPVQNTLFVKQKAAQELKNISIYNVVGKQVLYNTINTVNVSSLSSGLYLVKINTTAGSITKKIIKK